MQCVDELEQIKAKLIDIKPILPDPTISEFKEWLREEFNFQNDIDLDWELTAQCEACDYISPEQCSDCDDRCNNYECDKRRG